MGEANVIGFMPSNSAAPPGTDDLAPRSLLRRVGDAVAFRPQITLSQLPVLHSACIRIESLARLQWARPAVETRNKWREHVRVSHGFDHH
jgi:hypothetical protein